MGMPYHHKPKKSKRRKCRICGRKLNMYNSSGECLYHSLPKDLDAGFDNHRKIDGWVSSASIHKFTRQYNGVHSSAEDVPTTNQLNDEE